MIVVGGTGHQNIPTAALDYVRREIAAALDRVERPLEGVTALAMGADQLFARSVLEREGRLHVVVPSREYERTFDEADRRSYLTLLSTAVEVETLNYPEPSEAAFLAAGIRVVELSDLLLAVWDGRKAEGLGGTADVVAHARETGTPVEVIWPEGVAR